MLAQRNCLDTPLFVVSGIKALQIIGYSIDVRLSLRQTDAGFESREHGQRMCAALPRWRRRCQGQGCPQVEVFSRWEVRSLAHERELAREHAHNHVSHAVQR